MKRLTTMVGFVLVIIMAVLVSGCGDGKTRNRGDVVAISHIEQASVEDLRQAQLHAASVHGLTIDRRDGIGNDLAEGGILDQAWKLLDDKILKPYAKYMAASYRITYTTTDASGRAMDVTGLLVVPYDIFGGQLSVPMLSLQHPTQVQRKYSPSRMNLLDNELTYQAALLMAMTGYQVVVADYPGLGDNADPHPYCHTSISKSVIDLMRAAENSTGQRTGLSRNTSWNGRLYLMGYSEGGYATMVTAKELQNAGPFRVDAVAPLDGPYSLSDTMRRLMVDAGPGFQAPYFLPYVIAGYDSVYGASLPQFRFDSAVKTDVAGYQPPPGSNYAHELLKLMDGSHTPADIDNFMQLVQPYNGPRSVLTDGFLANLEDTSSAVVKTLEANNAYVGWIPAMPVKMIHSTLDDLVPVGNLNEAVKAFPALPTIQSETFEEYIPGMGSVHSGALPFAYIRGFLWLDGYAHPERH